MASNISRQSVIDYVTTNVRGANLADVFGVQNEPALSICNDVYQGTPQKPLTWRFSILYWTTYQYHQDYALTNATAAIPACLSNVQQCVTVCPAAAL